MFCWGDSFLPFLPPSFPLPIPLPALTTAVQRQCLGVQGRTKAYTVQRVTVQRVTGRRGATPYERAFQGAQGRTRSKASRGGGGEPHTRGAYTVQRVTGRRGETPHTGGVHGPKGHGAQEENPTHGGRTHALKRNSVFELNSLAGVPAAVLAGADLPRLQTC